MSAKHRTPEYQRNARIWRARVNAAHKRGEPYPCWRCRGPILPGQPFDIGHRGGAIGSSEAELHPEHRHRTNTCVGNRADGGSTGARIRNSRRTPTIPKQSKQTWTI